MHRFADGRSMAETAAGRLLAAVPQSIAVIRPGDAVLEQLLADCGMRVIVCACAAQGMGRSLACGVAAAAAADGWVIALADMPCIRYDTICRVLDRLHSGAEIVAPYYAGRRGHPVGFRRNLFDQLLDIEQDTGARMLIERHAEKVSRLDVDDPGILHDIDYRADLDRLPLLPV